MAAEVGVSIYFRDDAINVKRLSLMDIGTPKYIHLLLDKNKKLLYIQACEKDKNAFLIQKSDMDKRFMIICKRFVRYLASVIGVKYDTSNSLKFQDCVQIDAFTLRIDLRHYEEVQYDLQD